MSAVLKPGNPSAMMAAQALTLIQLKPDGSALARWAAASGVAAFKDDVGYAAHAASKAVFGELAPKPFTLRMNSGKLEMIGYSSASMVELSRVASLQTHDVEAAQALGVDGMVTKPMPLDWTTGERFSFECRVVPTRRTRKTTISRYGELDAAIPEPGAEGDFDRDAAYGAWISNELSRFSAARLMGFSPFAFRLIPTARRTHAAQGNSSQGARGTARGLVPDLVARGELEVIDPAGFQQLLGRGLGRHRAFGYGCLLLAPRGVLYTGPSVARRLMGGV